jgi:hypothetical protein
VLDFRDSIPSVAAECADFSSNRAERGTIYGKAFFPTSLAFIRTVAKIRHRTRFMTYSYTRAPRKFSPSGQGGSTSTTLA